MNLYPLSFPYLLEKGFPLFLIEEKEILRYSMFRDCVKYRQEKMIELFGHDYCLDKKFLINIQEYLGYNRFIRGERVIEWIKAGMPAFIPVLKYGEKNGETLYRVYPNPTKVLKEERSSIFQSSQWNDWGDYLEPFGLFLKKTNQKEINHLKELRRVEGDIF